MTEPPPPGKKNDPQLPAPHAPLWGTQTIDGPLEREARRLGRAG